LSDFNDWIKTGEALETVAKASGNEENFLQIIDQSKESCNDREGTIEEQHKFSEGFPIP